MQTFKVYRTRREREYSVATIEAETKEQAINIAETDFDIDWKVTGYEGIEDEYEIEPN